MFELNHCGLYFTAEDIQYAQKNKKRHPFKAAWNLLLNTEQTESLARLQWAGLRYRFAGDVATGESALSILNSGMFSATVYETLLGNTAELRDAIFRMLALAQCFELLRDHPAYSLEQRAMWLEIFSGYVDSLRHQVYEPTVLETIWLSALNVVAGVVLERKDWFDIGVAIYQHTVNDSIHPEGYLPKVVNSGDGRSFEKQLSAVVALVLTAAAADCVGVNLWGHTTRGVSVLTAAAYPLYFYFYPEKWPWGETLTEQYVTCMFRERGGFLEIINQRYDRPLKAIKLMLDDLRPIYDCHGGGLATLSHAVAKRGLFG
jgi:hypothetical protein